MKITKLKLKNFRGFYKEQIIKFSTDEKKPITLIYAQNGVCKTTILFSILWCFHKKIPSSLKDEVINYVNKDAITKDNIHECSVSIDFKVEDKNYSCERTFNRLTGKDKLNVYSKDSSLSTIEEIDKKIIEDILPQSMADFFFFDGEATVNLVTKSGAKDLRSAIRNIIGCWAAESATSDLDDIAKDIRKEISKIGGKDDLKNKIREKDDQIKATNDSIKKYEDYILKSDEKIRDHTKKYNDAKRERESQAELKGKNDILNGLKNSLVTSEKLLESKKRDQLDWFSSNDLSSKLLDKEATVTLKKIEDKQGKFPSDVMEPLIDRILKDEKCICSQTEGLDDPNSKQYIALLKEKKQATTEEIYRRVNKANNEAIKLSNLNKGGENIFTDIQYNYLKADNAVIKLKKEINDALNDLKNYDNEKYKKIVIKEGHHEGKKDFYIAEKAKQETQLNQLKTHKDKFELEYGTLLSQDKSLQPYNDKLNFINEIKDRIAQEVSNHEKKTKDEIEKEIQDTLQKYWRDFIDFELTDDFKINVKDDAQYLNDPHYHNLSESEKKQDSSQGQSSLIAQTFISVLLKYYGENKSKNKFFIAGVNAPLVIDSPFSKLDNYWRKISAGIVSESVDQLIYLVSSVQGPPEVIDVIKDKIGKTYICKGVTTLDIKQTDYTENDLVINYNGKNHEAFEFNSDLKKIVIEQVT